jgi:hypothetical protein
MCGVKSISRKDRRTLLLKRRQGFVQIVNLQARRIPLRNIF